MEPQKPSVGRIVHYVLKGGNNAGQVRAAIVTNYWGGTRINGTVFLDKLNDAGSEECFGSADFDDPTAIAERVSAGDGAPGYQPGTWHWPPRA